MSILSIITYPNPILEKKSKEVKDFNDPAIRELVLDMLETMEHNNGVGLAAPQVGHSLQLATMKVAGTTYVLINPKVRSKSWKKNISEEGCLSFPGQFFPVKRYAKIEVEALDRKGQKIVIKGENFLARVLQHELDHLNGILFTKRRVKAAPLKADGASKIDHKK